MSEKMGGAGRGRVRSASAGRDKRTEMACRYWAILLENLRRAVDDLYKTCEGDESCMYAREVIMHLDNYTKDFKSLVHRLKTMVEYENTPPPQRPSSLTWDIRKTSPMGKVTPASTPGKLTPTKHLLLCSPAKRQLNFESDLELGLRTARSRQVSETIREVGLEADSSPHQSWQDLQKQEAVVTNDNDDISNQQVLKVGSESDENGSEHEKSDSEQEKDAALAPTVADEITPPPPKVESEEKADPMTRSTDSAISEPEPTSKNSSNGDLSRAKKSSKTGKVSSTRVSAMNKTNANSKTSKSSVKSSDKITKSIDKTATTKSVTVSTTSSALKTTTTTSQAASSKRDKSAEQVKSHVRPTSSFASKVKSSTSSSSSSSTASNPKMTRAKTMITSNSKPLSAGSAVPRKTAAGLLITTTARAKAPSSAPVSKPAASAASGSSSPKTQRISLVARQAKFASEKKIPPGKKAPARFDLSRPRSVLGSGLQTPKPDLNDGNNNASRPPQTNLVGSNTSLSSGSSNRSYADSVRAGLSHHSVEDLTLNLSK